MRVSWPRVSRLGFLVMLPGSNLIKNSLLSHLYLHARQGLIEANREGLMSSLGYMALHLAGISWGSDLLFLASTPDHLFTSAGLLVVWLVLQIK